VIRQGDLINDRYEIIEKIGTGGMSVVYKARCTKLERFVAIKILKEEFCLDDEFVKKFKVEAQSAASLSHNNIVNIYDVGNENKIHFIVMEYLEGRTVKQYIKEKGFLSDIETMKISACIASALEHAHENHIIHRDIKPQNIIITNDGKVKVADFGIARIATDSTISVTDTATGSVHYIAPEQARGGYTDEKSDIYSLGITMYEMVTGDVPFKADSTISVALKHIHDALPLPSSNKNNPNINKNLEQIIIKATQKKSEMRYESASSLLDDLKKASNFPKEEFVHINSFEDDSPTLIISQKDIKAINNSKKRPSEKDKNAERLVMALGVFAAVVLVAIISYFSVNIIRNTFLPYTIDIPNLEGRSLEEAKILLDEEGIDYDIVEMEYSKTIDYNHIISQNQVGEIQLNKDEKFTLELVVSRGEELYEVPDVVNQNFEVAEKMIKDNNLSSSRELVYHDIVEMGEVIRQEPFAGEMVPPNTKVVIYVSLGKKKETVTMPDIRNRTLEEGMAILKENGLVPGKKTYVNNEIVKKGYIITTNVDSGTTVEKGYVVDLVVSDGRESITKTVKINDLFPMGQENGLVEVYLQLDGGERNMVYSNEVQRSDFPIMLNVDGKGTGTIEVYLDGNKEYSNAIYFDEVSN